MDYKFYKKENRKIVPVLDKSLNQIAKKKLEELKNNKKLFESLPNHFKENFEKVSFYNPSGNLEKVIPSSNFFEWFPYFIRSRNGIIVIIYWILPSLFSLVVMFFFNKKQINDSIQYNNAIELNDHVILITIFAFLNILFLIPAPSYTPWLTPIIFFLLIISYNSIPLNDLLLLKIKKFLLYFVFAFLIIISLKFSFGNQMIFKNLFQIKLQTKLPDIEYKIFKYNPKKWSPFTSNEDKFFDINVSQTNQCWNVPAPCITKGIYESLIKNK